MNAQIDQVFDGYRLIRFLGRGGFGEVWLCRSEAMGDYRALKIIPSTSVSHLQKEYEALLHYRKAAAALRSPHLLSIEHVNLIDLGLFYVMPLADGIGAEDPADPAWLPLTLGQKIHAQKESAQWFSSGEIIAVMLPVLEALQTLSDAGLVHRDVKPDNILFFDGKPCLGDVSLLGQDAEMITARGTPGYATPSWYVGGQPDMYGTAAMLYHLLTGNLPDKMGRSSFLWPPKGEKSLTPKEHAEWLRLHKIIRRACEEKPAERFLDFTTMARQLDGSLSTIKKKLPRVVIATCSLIGIAAATVVAAFRDKQASSPSRENITPDKTSTAVPELSEEEKNDYRVLVGLSDAYLDEGNYANALATIETLLFKYPQSRTQPQYSISRALALIGLERREEAIEELKKDIHFCTNIAAATTRHSIWLQLKEWEESENDLTRILTKFGPNTMLLYFRAETRILRNNMAGADADKKLAYAIKPDDLQQKNLVNQMWAPLETKYPEYATYHKSLAPPEEARQSIAPDPWILEHWDSITHDIIAQNPNISADAQRGRTFMAERMKTYFQKANYLNTLVTLEEIFYTLDYLPNTPVLSLFRTLLYQRLDQPEKQKTELARDCHQKVTLDDLELRVCLLDIMGLDAEAETLCSKVIATIDPANQSPKEITTTPWLLRAMTRAAQSNYAGAEEDRASALAIIAPSPDHAALRTDLEKNWQGLEIRYPAYAEFRKNLPQK